MTCVCDNGGKLFSINLVQKIPSESSMCNDVGTESALAPPADFLNNMFAKVANTGGRAPASTRFFFG